MGIAEKLHIGKKLLLYSKLGNNFCTSVPISKAASIKVSEVSDNYSGPGGDSKVDRAHFHR